MKKLTMTLGFLLMLIGVSAMAANKVEFTSPDKVILVKQDQPKFTITLESNPTTGFSWFLASYNPHMIKVVHQKYIAPNSKLMGAPGYEVWTFKVKKEELKVPQTMTIKMLYARPWEKKPGKEVAFRVFTVKN